MVHHRRLTWLVAATALTAAFRTDEIHTTLLDSLSYFGDISPDAIVWGQDAFEVAVSADCPGEHVIPFALSLAYGGTTRIVHPPAIEIATGTCVLLGEPEV